jgi:ABC-type transport system involved in multi-copper enzyme maturation permease subunit
MISAREVALTAQREVRRNLESTKGIVMVALFFLGGILPRFVQAITERVLTPLQDGMPLPEVAKQAFYRELFVRFLAATYADEPTRAHLARSPSNLYNLFWGTVAFLPLFILLIGFDQLAGEVQHRTLRYFVGRAFRVSLVVGKAIGVWALISLMTLVLHITVWILLLVQGGTPVAEILSWGSYYWLLSVFTAAAYVGFASLMSSVSRIPVVALFLGLGASLALYLFYELLVLSESVSKHTQVATWAFPNAYHKLMVSPDPGQALLGAGLYVAWGALAVAGASAVMTQRDL